MSDYIDRYRRRTLRRGETVGEAYESNTVAYIESAFRASPSFRELKVESTEFPNIKEIDARVVEIERMGSLREVFFRPYQFLNVGTYVKFDDNVWIVSDVWGYKTFTCKAVVQRCNHRLRFALSENWKDEEGKLDTSKVFEIHCISSQSPIGSKATQGKASIEFNTYDVRLPTAQLYVYLEKNEITKNIKLNQRFIFGGNVYEVYGVDDASLTNEFGYGIMQLTIKLTTGQDKDDFENQIAFNKIESEIENQNPDESNEDENDTGGRIW